MWKIFNFFIMIFNFIRSIGIKKTDTLQQVEQKTIQTLENDLTQPTKSTSSTSNISQNGTSA